MSSKDETWCVIPVYNHSSTLRRVVEGVLKYLDGVVVVDDGSTDANIAETIDSLPVRLLSHEKNTGKGSALRSGAGFALEHGCRDILTIDADGQHDPDDIPHLLSFLSDSADKIVIGKRDFSKTPVPFSSRFGRKFSDFWVRLETGRRISDTQSGFRVYPAKFLAEFHPVFNSYAFEIEILVRGAWNGFEIESVPISVTYVPDGSPRVSHFNPWRENFKLSLLHARLVAESIFRKR